jgi:hypothetical protein
MIPETEINEKYTQTSICDVSNLTAFSFLPTCKVLQSLAWQPQHSANLDSIQGSLSKKVGYSAQSTF